MVTVLIIEVLSKQTINLIGICASGNYEQKWNTKFCNY
jgi:hypothetical protein